MNYGQKELKRVLDDLDNMTIKEYEELYNRAKKRKNINLVDIEEVDIGKNRFRIYARRSYAVYSSLNLNESKRFKGMYQSSIEVLNTNKEKTVMLEPFSSERFGSIRSESFIEQDDSSLLAA